MIEKKAEKKHSMKEGIDYRYSCIKCNLHVSQWGSPACDRKNCEHESLEPPPTKTYGVLNREATQRLVERLGAHGPKSLAEMVDKVIARLDYVEAELEEKVKRVENDKIVSFSVADDALTLKSKEEKDQDNVDTAVIKLP